MDPRNRIFLRVAAKVWPGAFLIGAGMELFMIQTGFCARRSPRFPTLLSPSFLVGDLGPRRVRADAVRASCPCADRIVTRKEAERRADRDAKVREYVERRRERKGAPAVRPSEGGESAE